MNLCAIYTLINYVPNSHHASCFSKRTRWVRSSLHNCDQFSSKGIAGRANFRSPIEMSRRRPSSSVSGVFPASNVGEAGRIRHVVATGEGISLNNSARWKPRTCRTNRSALNGETFPADQSSLFRCVRTPTRARSRRHHGTVYFIAPGRGRNRSRCAARKNLGRRDNNNNGNNNNNNNDTIRYPAGSSPI